MTKEFIPYNEALALKELGFDEPCFTYFLNGIIQPSLNPKDYTYFSEMSKINKNMLNYENVLAPTFSQAFRFFREVYNIYVEISFNQKYENSKFGYIIRSKSSCLHTRDFPYKTYEEAELACLQKLIEITKKL